MTTSTSKARHCRIATTIRSCVASVCTRINAVPRFPGRPTTTTVATTPAICSSVAQRYWRRRRSALRTQPMAVIDDREEEDHEAEGEQHVGDGLGDLSERMDADRVVDSGEGPVEVVGGGDDHARADERDEHRHTAEDGEQPHRPPMPSVLDAAIREDDERDREQRRLRLPHPREHPQRERRTRPPLTSDAAA